MPSEWIRNLDERIKEGRKFPIVDAAIWNEIERMKLKWKYLFANGREAQNTKRKQTINQSIYLSINHFHKVKKQNVTKS